MQKQKKAVIITAACHRLGLVFTQKSLAMGYNVVAVYRTQRADLDSWLVQNTRYRRHVHFLQADLARLPAAALIAKARKTCTVECVGLVNNASVFTRGALDNRSHFEKAIRMNALIPLDMGRAFYESTAKDAKGWIINITDACIEVYNRNYQNYRTSKLILTELTRQMAHAFSPRLRVNALAPGAMLPPAGENDTYLKKIAARMPLLITPSTKDLIDAYAFLATTPSVTGQILSVDAGWHLI